MQPLEAELLQDASSLLQFVSSIADLCVTKSETFAHRAASERFFSYIKELAEATEKHLVKCLEATKPRDLLQLRRKIASLRISWRFLHEYVKPALDADTLNLPTSLIQGLAARFCEIPQFRDTDFVLFHVDRFNYLNVTLAHFRARAGQISSVVSGPEFPSRLSIIGLPYSQSSALFLNCLIPHEMGHYVCGERSIGTSLKKAAETELRIRLGSKRKQAGRLAGVIAKWLEELFCDAFAVRLVGLCFSAAFVEMFDLARYLDQTRTLSSFSLAGETEFTDYPPDLLRLRQQYLRLDADGWWRAVARNPISSHYIAAIRAAKDIKDTQFKCTALKTDYNIDPAIVLESFFAVLPQIEVELDASTAGLRGCADQWSDQTETIESYLAHGVVPSSLCAEPGAKPRPPDVPSLLNSAYRFYMLKMTKLISDIAEADPSNISQRVYWTKRVEAWTAKAIEDVLLIKELERDK